MLYDKKVPTKLKSRLYKITVRPVLYSMVAAAVTRGQESQIDVGEMRMLRFSLGKIRLEKTRGETNQGDFLSWRTGREAARN